MIIRVRKSLVAVILTSMLLLSTVALSSCGSGTSGNSKYRDAIKTARSGLWEDINSGKASSGQVSILDGGSIVYSEAFGMADRATSTPVTTETLFNSGSIGKLYCATAVMKLVEAGRVNLDSPVVEYLPEFKMADPRYKDITVRMLLDHQSGIPGTTCANDFGYKVNPDFYSQVYDNLSRSHLKTAPGYSAPYCNDGFTLAEMLIAKISGRKYIDYLTDEVLKPLSLSRTGVSIGARPDAGVAAFYDPDNGKKVPPEAVTLLGTGGLSTTAEELVCFGDSFTKGGPHVLSQKSIDEMTKAHRSIWAEEAVKQVGLNPELAYGLGLDAVSIPRFQEQGINVIAKAGDTMNFHSDLVVAPDSRIAVAVIEAGYGSSAPEIALDMLEDVLVAKGLMKEEQAAVTEPKTPQQLPPSYESFSGPYDAGLEIAAVAVDSGNNTISITRPESEPVTMTYNNGFLYDPEGNTWALISVDGQTVLLKSVIGLWMTTAQQIPAAADPKSMRVDINGSRWLRRNAKPWEALELTSGYVVTSSTETWRPGYAVFVGSKLIESPTFAGTTSAVIRDESELTLLDMNGQIWAQVSDKLFSPLDAAQALNIGQKSVTIGKEGYNEWLKAGQDLILDVKKPEADRVIVFSPDSIAIYDSVIDNGKVFVPAGDLIELAGSPGDTFEVMAASPAD